MREEAGFKTVGSEIINAKKELCAAWDVSQQIGLGFVPQPRIFNIETSRVSTVVNSAELKRMLAGAAGILLLNTPDGAEVSDDLAPTAIVESWGADGGNAPPP